MHLNAIFQEMGKWYVAWVEEIPGVNTQGRTIKEARKNLKDALFLIRKTKICVSAKTAKNATRR